MHDVTHKDKCVHTTHTYIYKHMLAHMHTHTHARTRTHTNHNTTPINTNTILNIHTLYLVIFLLSLFQCNVYTKQKHY